MAKIPSSVFTIAKHTLADEATQKSLIIMFILCGLFIFLTRGCYQGNYMINGQALDAAIIVRTVSKAVFHLIGAGVMLIVALLSMRIFRRDRDDGTQSCILSKPIARRDYIAGKVLGLWFLSIIFMFILHSIVFLITSVNLRTIMPGYLIASLLCSFNLLFVIVAVFLLSLIMPDIIAFLCVVAVGIVSFVAEGISTLVHSPMAQTMAQQPDVPSNVTFWKIVYYAWPKLSGTQQFASSFIGSEGFGDLAPLYPFVNILIYCFILAVLLFRLFRNQDII